MFDSGIQNQQTRDELATNPNEFDIVKFIAETIIVEEGPTVSSTTGIGDAWIVGSSTNGLVGPNTNTAAGTQQIVGGTNTTTITAVMNPSKIFHEHFNFTLFKGTPFTANWDTTYPCKLRMHTSSNHATAYNTVATSTVIAKKDGEILRAILSSTEIRWGNDVIKYYLRTNTSYAWEEVFKDTQHIFTNTGEDLYCRIIFIGNGGSETYIEDLNIDYG